MSPQQVTRALKQVCGDNGTVEYHPKMKHRFGPTELAYWEITAKPGFSFYEDGTYDEIEEIANKFNLTYDEDTGTHIELFSEQGF